MIARLMPALLHRLTRFASAPVAVLLALTTLMLTLAHRPAAADDLLGDLVSRPLSVAFLGPADGPHSLSIDLNTGHVITEAPNQADHQQWVITPLPAGQYRLSNAILGEDFALTAQGRDRPLLMTPADGSTAQRWSFRLNGEGYELMTGDGALGLLYDPAHLSALILVDAGECCNGFQSWDLDGQAGAFAAVREARQTSDGLLPEAWSQPTDLTPEFFFADDVVEAARTGMVETMAAATEAWGNFGPLEYWVMGTDPEAANALLDTFCQRRDDRGEWSKNACLQREKRSEHGLISYQQLGADALANGQPSGSAGHNGGFDWGIHRFSSSVPLGMSGLLGVPGEQEQKTVLHEYFHAVQHAHVRDLDRDARDRKLGPVWWMEGAAEYMAMTTHARLQAEGKIPVWDNGDWTFNFRNYRKNMGRKFRHASEDHKRHDCVAEMVRIDYDSPCRSFFYDGGAWAVALLVSRHGEAVLLDEFYPRLASMDFEAAFEATFDQTPEAFYAEFRPLIEGKLGDALALLPTF